MKEAIQNSISERLLQRTEEIMETWKRRAKKELVAAKYQKDFALRDSLPEFITHLADSLSGPIQKTERRKKAEQEKSSNLGKEHGRSRAESINYTLDQLIFEYHILRQVIFEVLERDLDLKSEERNLILNAIEQAVNDAAAEFTKINQQIQQTFTYALAHDLRGSLTVIKAAAQMISRKPEDFKNCGEKANRISSTVDRLDLMILDLLDAARLEAGEELKLEFEECDLDKILHQVKEDFTVSHKNIIQIKSKGPCIGYWNSGGLRRVLENLADNAIKYGEINKPITISLEQNESSAQVTVHNQGKVIPPEEQSILFEPFKRSQNIEGTQKGWGIGLSVVKGIIDAHKGSIKVESEKNIGTNFIFNIPKNLH